MSRAALGLLVASIAVAVLPTLAVAECQEFTYPGGSYKQGNCGGTSGNGKEPDPWYATNAAQTVYWLLGVAGSGGVMFVGWNRVRRRRRELRTFLTDVETTFAGAKTAPDEGLPKLEKLRKGLQASHDAGRIEDAQFLEMDKRLADYVVRIRMLEVERWFPQLPIALVGEIRNVISDGHFSRSDLSLVEKRAIQLDVAPHVRKDLQSHLAKWAKVDVGVHPVDDGTAPFTARKIAVVARK